MFGPLVLLQGSFLFEGFLTLGACMLLLISSLAVDEVQVAQQVGPLGEGLATLRAQVGLLSRVDSFVGDEIAVSFES